MRKPKVENKYNIQPKDFEKLKVLDKKKIIDSGLFFRNNANNSYTKILASSNNKQDLQHGSLDECFFIIYDEEDKIEIKFTACELYSYNFDNFYDYKEIDNMHDLIIQEKFLELLNYLLDEKMIEIDDSNNVNKKESEDIYAYKKFEKVFIGSSDISSLIMLGFSDSKSELLVKSLLFGEDGNYKAYNVTNKNVKIPDYYKLIEKFNTWLKIYDDEGLVLKINADNIEIYRSGDFGCIIKSWNNNDTKTETIDAFKDRYLTEENLVELINLIKLCDKESLEEYSVYDFESFFHTFYENKIDLAKDIIASGVKEEDTFFNFNKDGKILGYTDKELLDFYKENADEILNELKDSYKNDDLEFLEDIFTNKL